MEYKRVGQKIFLSTESATKNSSENKTLLIEVITPRIIRVFDGQEGEEDASYAIEGEKVLPTELEIEEREDGLWISTQKVRVRISKDLHVDFLDEKDREVCCDYRGERKPLVKVAKEHKTLLMSEGHTFPEIKEHFPIEVVKKIQGTEHFYGLGDKTGFLDKRHYEYEMWNTDDPSPHVDSYKALYKSVPFFMTLTDTHAYGIFADNTYRSYFDMGKESEEYFWFASEGGVMDYYYIAGENLPEVLEGYTYLTGRTPVPQRWALGYHQSRWGYVTKKDIEEVADGMRKNDIPCDCIHLDIDYMQNYKVFTWNESLYGGEVKPFIEALAQKGFKIVTINDPGVKKEDGYPIYEEGVKNHYFATTPEGEVYINAVWPGDAAFPDFGNPQTRTWWGEHQKFLLERGVRGIWNDMNEPASFRGPLPDDIVFTDKKGKTTHAKMHNVYGHLMAKASFEGLKKEDGKRPFVITRACYSGSQKYTSVWTGDNTSLWSHLQMVIPQLCNLGMSGISFAGTDIGGFGADTTPELLSRWIQVGCFSPLFRNHSALRTRRQEPWQFGKEVLDIYRKYVKLRYHFLPYFYDLFYEGEKTGAPLMRPLVYHYEKDEVAKTCNDEFLLGSQVLVAPVVMPGMTKRMVYLPKGEWFDYWTGEKITGASWLIKDAPMDVCPLYVKAGSILPVMEECSYVGEREENILCLEIFPGEGEYDHYLDNGEDFAYRKGEYHQYHFTVEKDGSIQGRIVHDGYLKPYEKIMIWQELGYGPDKRIKTKLQLS